MEQLWENNAVIVTEITVLTWINFDFDSSEPMVCQFYVGFVTVISRFYCGSTTTAATAATTTATTTTVTTSDKKPKNNN